MCVFDCNQMPLQSNNQAAANVSPENKYYRWLMQASANTMKDTRPLAERRGWLTQAEIDKPEIREKSSRIMEWLESEPKGISTLAVIVGFALGMWTVLSVMNLIK